MDIILKIYLLGLVLAYVKLLRQKDAEEMETTFDTVYEGSSFYPAWAVKLLVSFLSWIIVLELVEINFKSSEKL